MAELFKTQVYPDMIGSHEPDAGSRGGGGGRAPTLNAKVAAKCGRAVREAFGADGAKLLCISTQ